MMTGSPLLLAPIVLPAVAALLVLVLPRRQGTAGGLVNLGTSVVQLGLSAWLAGQARTFEVPWVGHGLDFVLRLDAFSAFVMVATAAFSVLLALYSLTFLKEHPQAGRFHGWMLLTLALTTGAMLADNLVLMLFFWEGLLVTLFTMISTGGRTAWKTAVKAVVIVGLSDLCLMFGIGLAGHLAGTLSISRMDLATGGLGSLAFVMMAIGATSKAGSLPFHTWIPDAAVDAPLPFMAFVPAALEKLLGIYFLARITLDIFALDPSSWLSTALMVLGAVTILVAVMMALVQKDYKRLLSYHAISQVGYMILGVGTALPVGIVGGLFHMINHAMYKSCLFLTGGAVEKQAGTTDLSRLGGLGRAMPVTMVSFLVAAAAISGVPPFNGFFSKELVYDGALARHWGFYAAALLGSLLTAASFLKLGHAAFFGPRSPRATKAKDPAWTMLLPMGVLALGCIVFGVYNPLPLRGFVQPVLGDHLAGHDYSGLPHSAFLVVATLAVIGLAVLNHWYGVRRTGRGLGAVDHVHHAPVLAFVYQRAERRWFDPYDLGLGLTRAFSWAAWAVDRGIDWVYDVFSVRTLRAAATGLRDAHTGSYALYVAWSLAGFLLVALLVGRSL